MFSVLSVSVGIYANNTGTISDAYPTGLTPSGWTFSIWGIIYLWQALWLVYAVSTLFRRGVDGYLYYSPDILPAYIYICYMINNITNVVWLVVWSQASMIAALVVILIATGFLYVCSAGSYFGVSNNIEVLVQNGLQKEIWFMRWLVQNGIGIYDTWLSVATLINLTIVIIEHTSMSYEDASTLGLVLLGAELVGWFFTDILLLDRFTRYVFVPYLVYMFALSGIIDKNYQAGERNSVITAVLLAIACTLSVVKIIIMIVRHIKSRDKNNVEDTPLRGWCVYVLFCIQLLTSIAIIKLSTRYLV